MSILHRVRLILIYAWKAKHLIRLAVHVLKRFVITTHSAVVCHGTASVLVKRSHGVEFHAHENIIMNHGLKVVRCAVLIMIM